MIEWLFNPKEEKDWTYGRAEILLKSRLGDRTVKYPARVRCANDEVQILAGAPKRVSWQTVEDEDLKQSIEEQVQ